MSHHPARQQDPAPLVQAFCPPLTFWDQWTLRSANDNTMPWGKRIIHILRWSSVFSALALLGGWIASGA